MRRWRGTCIAVLALLLLAQSKPSGGSDFPIAVTVFVEEAPAVAYNSLTGQFLVAYRLAYQSGGTTRHRVQCQLLSASGSKIGDALSPFNDADFEVLGRPALAYNTDANTFLVAAPVDSSVYGTQGVAAHVLNGDGTNRPSSLAFLFPGQYEAGFGTGSIHVLYNEVLGEFLVTIQQILYDNEPTPSPHNVVLGQRISDSIVHPAALLVDFGPYPVGTHAIALAPMADSDPVGGRYLFAAGWNLPVVLLLDSQLNIITPVPVTWGNQDEGVLDYDIAYGEVGGRNMFLVGFLDNNNCKRGYQSCPDVEQQWRGIWGTYVDPAATAYLPLPAPDVAFPISYISYHTIEVSWLGMMGVQGPRLSYAPDARGFFAVWREVPNVSTVEGLLTHIRGAFVDYYVDNASTAPLPGPDSNTVLSDVTGACPAPGDPKYPVCESEQDPRFPAVVAGAGPSAAVVWHQRYPPNPADLDVYGDVYTVELVRPDLVESALADPPVVGWPGMEFGILDTVANEGPAAAGASTTRFYLSTDNVKSRFDIPVTTRSVPALAAGGTDTGGVSTTVPAGVDFRPYYLIACADALGAVAELDETNNCRASNGVIVIGVAPLPDLIENWVGSPPATATAGGTIQVSDQAGNPGNAAAGASTTRYYLSADTAKDAGDTLLTGSRAVPALAVGTVSGDSVTVAIPASTAGGTYYVIACADDMRVVPESDETNNCLASATTVTIARATKASFDFNGDGKSDILWRHTSAGDMWLWSMNGAQHTDAYVSTVGEPAWQIRGLGDQTGDGRADILWRHATTGQIYSWTMDGSAVKATTYVGTVDPGFDIVGTQDDREDYVGWWDILWRHGTTGELWWWLMNGAEQLEGRYLTKVDPAYEVQGSGDLNADGSGDLVWKGTAGDVWVWLMSDWIPSSVAYVSTVADLDYQIVGVADYTGDGKADLLWRHATRGEVWLWQMSGAGAVNGTWVGTVPDVNYRIVGTGDYDGDGKADILWHHATAGDVWVWLMNGAVKLSQHYVGTVPDTGYQIVRSK